jgi:hypothetical protein
MTFTNQTGVSILYFPHICVICPAYPILLDLITHYILWIADQTLLSFVLCSILHLAVTPYLLGPNITLSIVFSDTLNICTSMETVSLWRLLWFMLRTEN